MKKITSLMTLLLMFIVNAAVSAQTKSVLDTETNLITDASQFSSPFSQNDHGNADGGNLSDGILIDGDATTYWHSYWGGGNVTAGTHYLQVEVAELPEEWGFSFTRRVADNDHTTLWGVYYVPADNPSATKAECTFVAEVETPFGSNRESLTSDILANNDGATIIRFYSEEQHPSSRGYWHISEFAIHPVIQQDAKDVAIAEAATVYGQYVVYSGTFEAGEGPGSYGLAEVEAFEAALAAAEILETPEAANLTYEDIDKLAEDIKATYEAVINSRKSFATTVAAGYYYIKSALDFKTTETTEPTIDPDTEEEIPGETIETHHIKAVYTNVNEARWGELNDSTRNDANYLWKIVATDNDKVYHLINCQNENQFTVINQSAAVNLSAQDTLVNMVFDYAGEEGIYNIRVANQNERGYNYMHCNGHGGGTGKSSNIVGWCNTYENGVCGASEWTLEAVDEELALAIIEACSPAKKLKAMINDAAEMIAATPEMIRISEDVKVDLDLESPLITDPEQFSSPYSQNDLGGADGQDLNTGCLIDNNPSTFWHSYWGGGDVANGVHYLQIKDIDTSIDGVAFYMQRRSTANDHVTKMSVYGFNEDNEELTKENGELLAELNFPNPQSGAVINSDVFLTKGYPVLRIYEEMTNTNNGRGYWHAAEIQLYPATISTPYETTQAKERAAEIAALNAAIEAWNAIENLNEVKDPAEIEAQYNALKAAYDAFTAVYADPAALRNAIASAPDASIVKIGKNPGQWSDESTLTSLTSLIAEAQAYDASCKYTPEQSEAYVAAIAAADSTLFASANKVQTGKWYTIRFGSEEEYEEGGWDSTPGSEIVSTATGATTSEGLLGKVVVASKHDNETATYTDDSGAERTETIYTIVELEADDATFGKNAAFMDYEGLDNKDAALWQFVAIGDSAYVIQNKATGLYLRAAGTSGATTLSVHPTTFTQEAIGAGRNIIRAKAITGQGNAALHGERATSNLVTWAAYTIESNSALYIEEIEDVTEQPSNEFTMSVWPGALKTMVYPTSIEVKKGGKVYTASVEGTTVTLNPLKGNVAAAGQPVVFIADGEYEELVNDEEDPAYNGDAYVNATMIHGTEFVNEEANAAEDEKEGTLFGTFNAGTIGKGHLVLQNNAFAVTTKSSNNVAANEAFIVGTGNFDKDTEITLVISAEEVDAIEETLATVNKIGGIYTIDGKFIGKGNLNNLKNMPKGVYVVNGVKVAVK